MSDRHQFERQQLLIDGKRQAAASGKYYPTVNPATEQVIAMVAEADAADADLAVAAARRALEGAWGKMRPSDRGRILFNFAELLRKRQDELVELESLDTGKPVAAV